MPYQEVLCMGRQTPVVGIVLVVVGLMGMAVTLAYQWTSSGALPAPMRSSMDAMFIQQMIPHHDDAIAMADLALIRAERPELKELAERIKRTQTAENAQMRAWYRQWFGTDVPAGGGHAFGMMGGATTDLEALDTAEDFDRAFLEEMIPHHRMAVMMSRMAGSATSRPQMRELTQTISDVQRREIEQMEDWHREWFGRGAAARTPKMVST
jgi:uncharacterized protein (DUF305 family)